MIFKNHIAKVKFQIMLIMSQCMPSGHIVTYQEQFGFHQILNGILKSGD